MDIYQLTAILFASAVLVSIINHRFIKMPTTIAIMVASLMLSFVFIISGQVFGMYQLEYHSMQLISQFDFQSLLLNGLLSFLLFAGAMQIELKALKKQLLDISILASLSTIASTFLIAVMVYYLLAAFSIQIHFVYCLLFGALISPTDPVAVLNLFKEVGAPKKLEITVMGESLFNDGVGIVIFITIYQLAFQNVPPTFSAIGLLFLKEAIGGLAFGAALGLFAILLLSYNRDYKLQVLITIATVSAGYALARMLDVSGPLAMVMTGIMVGNAIRHPRFNDTTRGVLFNFWELIDELLNAWLFLLLGLELLTIYYTQEFLVVGLLAIPLVLLARFITVTIPIQLHKLKQPYPRFFNTILIWGGLRGGLAVALALSIPASDGAPRDLLLTMTYAVVSFSIIVQGLTIKPLVKRTS